MARIVGSKTGAIAPNKAVASSRGKGKSTSGPGSREPKQKPQVTAFNESTVEAINKAGPKGHEIAHINPREGRILEALGGSGKKDPETKIKSYERVVGKKTAKDSKLPKGKGRGRFPGYKGDNHQVAVLTDPEVEALNTMRWKDKDRGFVGGFGPEIQALADQNDRPFEFLEYRGERIPTLNGGGEFDDMSGDEGEQEGRDQLNEASGGDSNFDWAAYYANLEQQRIEREEKKKEEERKKEEEKKKKEEEERKRIEEEWKKMEEKISKEEQRLKEKRERIAREEEEQRKEDERLAKEAQEEADRVVAEAEEAERIEREAEEQAQDELDKEEADALALQEEIKEEEDYLEQYGFDESDDYLEGEGDYEGDEGYDFDEDDEESLDLEGVEPEQDTGDYYDFNEELGDEVLGDVAGVTDEDGNPMYWHYDPYDYDEPVDETFDQLDDEAYDENTLWDRSGQPTDYGEPDDDDTDTFDSNAPDTGGDSGGGPPGGGDPGMTYDPPDDDDTDTFDDSGFFDQPFGDYEPDDDDTDTYDASNDPDAGSGTFDDFDDSDEGFDEPGTGFDDFDDSLEGFDDEDDDPPGGGGDDGDGDGGTGTGTGDTGPTTTGDTDKDKLLAELDAKYADYGETDYEALFRGEFEDDLKEDYDASRRSAERAFLTSGDLSEFNTTGNTINDQLLALEGSFEGDQKDYLDEMSANYATGPKRAIEEWYKKQRKAILSGEIDSIPELDLSEWSDPSDEYDPEFFKDVEYSKLYENMEGDTVAQDESGDYYDREDQDPTDYYANLEQHTGGIDPNKGPEPLELDFDPNIPDPDADSSLEGSEDLHGEVVDGTWVPETLDDEGDDQMGGGDDLGFGDDGLDDVVGGDDDMLGVDPETGEPIDYGESFNFGDVIDPDDIPDQPLEPEPEPEPEAVDTTPVADGEPGLYGWIDDDRIPSQAEIDFYMNLGGGGEVTQDHVDEIQEGLGVNPGDEGYIYYDDSNLGTENADPVFDVFEDEGNDQMGGDDSLEGFDFGDEFPPGYVDPSSMDLMTDDQRYDQVDEINEAEGYNPSDSGYMFKDDMYFDPYSGLTETRGGGYNTLDTMQGGRSMTRGGSKPSAPSNKSSAPMDFNFGPGGGSPPAPISHFKDTRVSNKERPLRASERPRRKRNIYNQAA